MRRRAALVRHVMHLRLAHVHEQFRGHVQRAARSARCVNRLVRVRLDPGHQLRHSLRVDRRMNRQQQRHDVRVNDRLEVLHRVVWQALEQPLVRRVAGGHDHERVAVGRALGHEVGAQVVRGTWLVLDHDRLAERDGHLLGERTRDQVDRAAGRRRDHDPDRARRIRLRCCVVRAERNARRNDRQLQPVLRCHGLLSSRSKRVSG